MAIIAYYSGHTPNNDTAHPADALQATTTSIEIPASDQTIKRVQPTTDNNKSSLNDIKVFEDAYSAYLTSGSKFTAPVLISNMTSVNTGLQRYDNDFVQIAHSNDTSTRLALAEDGISFVQANQSYLEQTDALETVARQNILNLNTAAAALANVQLRNQAVIVASLASSDLQKVRAYKGAIEDKQNLIIKSFQDIINDGGGESSFALDAQSSSAQMQEDNDVLQSYNTNVSFGVDTANAYAQFQGLVKMQ